MTKCLLNSLIDLAIHLDHLIRNCQVRNGMVSPMLEIDHSAPMHLGQARLSLVEHGKKGCVSTEVIPLILWLSALRVRKLQSNPVLLRGPPPPSHFLSHQWFRLDVQIKHSRCFWPLSADRFRIIKWSSHCHNHCLYLPSIFLAPTTGESSDFYSPIDIPTEYHEYQEVFSKVKPSGLPLHRSYDCAIELLPGTYIPPHNRIYSLSLAEQQAIKDCLRGTTTRLHSSLYLPLWRRKEDYFVYSSIHLQPLATVRPTLSMYWLIRAQQDLQFT